MAVVGNDKEVRLYYLGGLENKQRAGRVTADGKAFALPSAGEYIEIPKRVADQLIGKHKYRLPNGDYVSAFTFDARVAKRIKEGMTVQDAQTIAQTLAEVGSETLLAELKRRGISTLSDDDEDTKKTPAKPKGKQGKQQEKAEGTTPEDLLGNLGLENEPEGDK